MTAQAGKRLAKELFSPEGGGFAEAMNRIQARRDAHEAGADAGPASVAETDSSGAGESHVAVAAATFSDRADDFTGRSAAYAPARAGPARL